MFIYNSGLQIIKPLVSFAYIAHTIVYSTFDKDIYNINNAFFFHNIMFFLD